MRMRRRPTSPGEILRDEFLGPSGLSSREIADRLGVAPEVVDGVLTGEGSVTPELAAKLEEEFGASSSFWLNAQSAVERYCQGSIETMVN